MGELLESRAIKGVCGVSFCGRVLFSRLVNRMCVFSGVDYGTAVELFVLPLLHPRPTSC